MLAISACSRERRLLFPCAGTEAGLHVFLVREKGGPGTDGIGHTPVIGGTAVAIANEERLSRSEWIEGECSGRGGGSEGKGKR